MNEQIEKNPSVRCQKSCGWVGKADDCGIDVYDDNALQCPECGFPVTTKGFVRELGVDNEG